MDVTVLGSDFAMNGQRFGYFWFYFTCQGRRAVRSSD